MNISELSRLVRIEKEACKMYCEECNSKPATVHLAQVVNGKKVETHLCETCAAKKGMFILDLSKQFSIPNLLGSIFGAFPMQGMQSLTSAPSCPNCGMTPAGLRDTGKLGCSQCYQVFDQELEPTLRRIHGNNEHLGKIPSRSGGKVLLNRKITQLKNQLQEAVAKEEYEKAAEIRDSIKELEAELE